MPKNQRHEVQPFGGTAKTCHFSQFCIISRLSEGALFSASRSINIDVKQHWTYVQPCGTWPVTGLQLVFGMLSPLSSSAQPVLNPPHCPLTHPAMHPFVHDNVMRDSVKSLYQTQNKQTSTALPMSTKWVILPQQTSRLVSSISLLAILSSTYFNSN